MPKAVNIQTCADKVDKVIPGFRAGYDSLSEFAHPNWVGVTGLFSEIDKPNFVTHFGRGLRTDIAGLQLSNALVGGLLAFEHAYTKIAVEMEVFLTELTPLSAPRKGNTSS